MSDDNAYSAKCHLSRLMADSDRNADALWKTNDLIVIINAKRKGN